MNEYTRFNFTEIYNKFYYCKDIFIQKVNKIV